MKSMTAANRVFWLFFKASVAFSDIMHLFYIRDS